METKRCISSLTLEQLTAELKAMGQPGFRAKQIFHWVHQKLVTDFSAMTDQPKALLAKLEEAFYIAAPIIERRQEAKDGTVKYLLRMADGNCIETVVMRYHYGNTVCVSTQVGCRMGCRFCASTQAGRVRNLEAGEICSEIYTAQKDIGERISHIVLMGIGEPLDNFDEVMRFLENISSPEGVNIGMRNISLSTCGLVPKIDQLAEKKLQPLRLPPRPQQRHPQRHDARERRLPRGGADAGRAPVSGDDGPESELRVFHGAGGQRLRRLRQTAGRPHPGDGRSRQPHPHQPGGRQPLFGYRRRQRPALPAEAGKPRRQRHRPPPSGQRDQRRVRPAPPRRDERQSLRRRIL